MPNMWKCCAGLMLLLATACATEERPGVVLRRDFPSVEIQRLGAHNILYADFGDRAVLNALHRLVQAGVPKENIEHVSLTAFHSRFRVVSGDRPDSYDLEPASPKITSHLRAAFSPSEAL